MKSRELAIGGLLTALALLIPLAFGGVLGIDDFTPGNTGLPMCR